jgi:predicted N-acyltransferase
MLNTSRASNLRASSCSWSPLSAVNLVRPPGPLTTVCRSRATKETSLELSLVDDIQTIGMETWDGCAGGANPLHSYAFLSAMERSNSACIKSGWAPQHMWVTSGDVTVAVVPLYLKGNSYGEYVFDSAFAEFWHASLPDMRPAERKAYYPKLLSAVPFTPCTCSKVLINKESLNLTGMGEAALMAAVADTIRTLPRRMGVSSLHVNFTSVEEIDLFSERGFIARTGMQYHWTNEQYSSFDDFLARLKQSRRKTIRQERRKVNERLHIRRLTGDELKSPRLWDAFFEYYLNTVRCRSWPEATLGRARSRTHMFTWSLPML